jgi:hypothetical protein
MAKLTEKQKIERDMKTLADSIVIDESDLRTKPLSKAETK